MRAIFRAVMSALASLSAFTWRKCRLTGRWILERVAAIGAVPAVPITAPADAIDDLAVAQAERLQCIRQAALALVGATPDAQVIARLEEHDYRWLSALDKEALCRIGFASNVALRDHLTGKRVIAGIVASDPESVNAYLEWKHRVRHDDEPEDSDDAELSLWSVPAL